LDFVKESSNEMSSSCFFGLLFFFKMKVNPDFLFCLLEKSESF